jgi:hypothetical protein
MTIFRNRAKCKLCRDIIESVTDDDFIQCNCRSVAVFGGTKFLGRKGGEENIIELSQED